MKRSNLGLYISSRKKITHFVIARAILSPNHQNKHRYRGSLFDHPEISLHVFYPRTNERLEIYIPTFILQKILFVTDHIYFRAV